MLHAWLRLGHGHTVRGHSGLARLAGFVRIKQLDTNKGRPRPVRLNMGVYTVYVFRV